MSANERIVVQTTAQDKTTIVAKAKRLGIPVSELMRRGAVAYESMPADKELEELSLLADAARSAADRAGAAIDDALSFIEASNRRIAAMEAKASRQHGKKAA